MKQHIISDPNILAGAPVIKGTRIPLERILYLFKEGYTIDDIHDEYDHVDKQTLKYVIEELNQMVGKKLNGSQTISL